MTTSAKAIASFSDPTDQDYVDRVVCALESAYEMLRGRASFGEDGHRAISHPMLQLFHVLEDMKCKTPFQTPLNTSHPPMFRFQGDGFEYRRPVWGTMDSILRNSCPPGHETLEGRAAWFQEIINKVIDYYSIQAAVGGLQCEMNKRARKTDRKLSCIVGDGIAAVSVHLHPELSGANAKAVALIVIPLLLNITKDMAADPRPGPIDA